MSGFEHHRKSDRVIATFSGFEADLLRSLASQMVELLRNERAEPPGPSADPFEALMSEFSGATTIPEDPVLAIDGGTDGLDVARACLDTAARALRPGGSLLLQLGNDAQAADLVDERFAEVERRPGERGIVVRLDLVDGPG